MPCPRMNSSISTGTQGHRRRRAGHREGLGEGQRCEQTPFLPFEREHRQERHGDDQAG